MKTSENICQNVLAEELINLNKANSSQFQNVNERERLFVANLFQRSLISQEDVKRNRFKIKSDWSVDQLPRNIHKSPSRLLNERYQRNKHISQKGQQSKEKLRPFSKRIKIKDRKK